MEMLMWEQREGKTLDCKNARLLGATVQRGRRDGEGSSRNKWPFGTYSSCSAHLPGATRKLNAGYWACAKPWAEWRFILKWLILNPGPPDYPNEQKASQLVTSQLADVTNPSYDPNYSKCIKSSLSLQFLSYWKFTHEYIVGLKSTFFQFCNILHF